MEYLKCDSFRYGSCRTPALQIVKRFRFKQIEIVFIRVLREYTKP